MYTGVGFINPGAQGFVQTELPACVTQAEHDEAAAKCVELRGLGGPRDMTGRLSGYSPCTLKRLPICDAPRCIDPETASYIAAYMRGQSVPADVRQFIEAGGWLLYFSLPFCSPPSYLQVPRCLDETTTRLLVYCSSGGGYPNYAGPDPASNSLCWLYQKDPSFWQRLMTTPPCAAVSEPPPGGGGVTSPPQAPPSGGDSLFPPGDQYAPRESRGAMAVGGILLLLAVGGGGYYMYRRSKRR